MPHSILLERDLPVRMRDGVTLRADVYRSPADTPRPTLLTRTPYGKNFSPDMIFAQMAAEAGYAVVIQDTRGRWASEGEDYPMLHEKADGHDTVMWAAQQTWSNGKVGMFGGSYVGYTQLAAAAAQPAPLQAIIPAITFSDPYQMLYRGGVLALGMAVSWSLMAGAQMAIEHEADPALKAALWELLIAAVDGMNSGRTFSTLPLDSLPLIGEAGLTRFFTDILDHPTPDEYWQPSICPPERIQTPALHIGGWYDSFLPSTLEDFVSLRAGAGSAAARQSQKLVIGPWVHGQIDSLNGDINFGTAASWMLVLPEETQLRWLDHWLKGEDNGVDQDPPVRLFIMGENRWRDENEWPLARTQYTPYYLHSRGAANTFNGDGVLSPQNPSDEPADSFLYDPRNPVPTRGGGLCCWTPDLRPGAFDQRPVEARPDVLVYTSPPLERDLEITGPLQVNLWAATTAIDTDFTAKLVDVAPDGYARNLADGILRARYRGGLDRPVMVDPGAVEIYAIDLGATANVFKTGHRIRLEISSSNYPRFERNPNTGLLPADSSELRTALQTVFHDSTRPSHIVLPVVAR